MVIKYSQLELAGNLYYPVAVICSAALLLAALGVFLRLSGAQHPMVDPGSAQQNAAGAPTEHDARSQAELAHRLA